MVHVDVMNDNQMEKKALMRPQQEIEADVKTALTAIPDILGTRSCLCDR